MAKVRKIKGREGYFLDYRLKDSTRIIKKAARSNRRGAEKELALIVSEIETKPGLRRLKKTTVGKMCEDVGMEAENVTTLASKTCCCG